MGTISEEMQGSVALQFVQAQGLNWKAGTPPNIELEICPACKHAGYGHFYLEVRGTDDPKKNRDGLFMCQRCGKSGNLYALRTFLGVANPTMQSSKSWASGEGQIDKLPDVAACHQALMEDADALDYLMSIRGLSREIIITQQLGLTMRHFRGQGSIRAIVFPYLVNGNIVWAHFRSLPDPNDLTKVQKAFNGPKGWEATLYNGQILREGIKDILFVEGEMDALCALDHGITNVCGVPGANIKKAEWLDTLDKIAPEKIYILYDMDKVGQKAAQALASRIGIERCWKIKLPEFKIDDKDIESRFGKDLNEWFLYGGGSLEAFEQLKMEAGLFDVDGVASSIGSLDEFQDELEGGGAGQKYATPWPSLTARVRFDEGDVIDILAPEKIGKTTFGMNLMEFMVDTYGEDGIIICLEMTRAKMARKWLSHRQRIADILANSTEEDDALKAAFLAGIQELKAHVANREGNLYFCYPKFKDADDIYKLIVDCIRCYGVKWIMFDNVQLLCDLTIGNRNRAQYLSEISKNLSKIAKDYGVQMVRILQPHRIAQGKVATSDSTDGSSQIGKDCDCQLILNRPRIGEIDKQTLDQGGYLQTSGTFGPDMHVAVGLSRYSAGGSTTLYMDGATSSIFEQAEGKIAEMNKKVQQAMNGTMSTALASLQTAFVTVPLVPLVPMVTGELSL